MAVSAVFTGNLQPSQLPTPHETGHAQTIERNRGDFSVGYGRWRQLAVPLRGLQTLVSGFEAVAVAAGIGFALALFLDHFGLGLGEETGIAELGGEFDEFGVKLRDLLA